MTRWNRSLGISKREQGIITPKRNGKRKYVAPVVEVAVKEAWYVVLWRRLFG